MVWISKSLGRTEQVIWVIGPCNNLIKKREMSTGTRPLYQSIPYIRGIYYFSFAVLFSSAPWLGFCFSVWLLGRMAGESSHQHSGEVKSQTDGAFPGDSATWLMALLRACPGIACRYNSLPFCHLPVPIWSQFMNWDGVYLSHEVTACLRITLTPSPPLHIPSGPLSSRSTELLFIVTGRTVQCITVSQRPLYCKGFISKKVIKVLPWANEYSQTTTLKYICVLSLR